MKKVIQTDTAPSAIGPYSQGIQSGQFIFLSGQIPLDPKTNAIISEDIQLQVTQVFENLKNVTIAAGGNLDSLVRIGIYLTDLNHFSIVNEIMTKYFNAPFPARSTIEVSGLPKGAKVEVDGIMSI